MQCLPPPPAHDVQTNFGMRFRGTISLTGLNSPSSRTGCLSVGPLKSDDDLAPAWSEEYLKRWGILDSARNSSQTAGDEFQCHPSLAAAKRRSQ